MKKQRLSWNEIKTLYPAQHVGLIDVIFEDEDQMNVKVLLLNIQIRMYQMDN